MMKTFPSIIPISLQRVVFVSVTIGGFVVISILRVSPVVASWTYFTTWPNDRMEPTAVAPVSEFSAVFMV